MTSFVIVELPNLHILQNIIYAISPVSSHSLGCLDLILQRRWKTPPSAAPGEKSPVLLGGMILAFFNIAILGFLTQTFEPAPCMFNYGLLSWVYSRETCLSRLVLLPGGSFKINYRTPFNICESGNIEDQWSNYCIITLI